MKRNKLKEATENFQRVFINDSLYRHKGNRSKVAEEMGLDRSLLWKKMIKLGFGKKFGQKQLEFGVLNGEAEGISHNQVG